jgi:hypothetical protein
VRRREQSQGIPPRIPRLLDPVTGVDDDLEPCGRSVVGHHRAVYRPARRVVDGPDVVARADSFLTARGLTDRIDAVAGDMFGVITATADVYLLKDVLHDWDDEHCRKILSTVAAAMPSGSRVVLIEILQQPNTPNPLAPWADLLMLTQTDGGRQRSVDELAALLTDAGLRPTGIVRQAIPHGLVEAVKP